MQYRTLGKTGLKVSQLGFGCMRFPMEVTAEGEDARVNDALTTPLIRRAVEMGVNYIDTAVFYCGHDSQRALGEALKGIRDQVILSTKNHCYSEDEKEWWTNLEDSLRLLQSDWIDIYNTHGISWQQYEEAVEPRISKWLQKAKDQGMIRHICTSFHDDLDGLMKIIDTGFYESITLQYNMMNRDLEDGIAHAHESGMGVVVMGPVGGGRLGAPNEALGAMVPGIERMPELALRFVLANPNVTVALSGMGEMPHVEEDARVCADPVSLSDNDREAIDAQLARLKKMADLYCTGCKYCLPCPQNIDIPKVFRLYNDARVYGLWTEAKRGYGNIGKAEEDESRDASACTDCGTCEEKCPQKIAIRQQLAEAHKALTAS